MSNHEIEPPRMEQMDKHFRVVITDGDKVVADEVMRGFLLVGEDGERMCEIVMNENIATMAALLHSGSKTKHAVRLATLMENMKRDEAAENATEFEDMLNDMLEGGLQ